LDAGVHQLKQADAAVVDLTEQLTRVELKGRWHNRDRSVVERQTQFRAQIAPPTLDAETELRYLVTDSGEILQLLASEEDAQDLRRPIDE
jgi:hypothetical protein